MTWHEAALIEFARRISKARAARMTIGNDAALLSERLARPVVCVDQTIAGVHFDAGTPIALVAHKACARALSDLAASVAEPRAVLLALRAPREARERTLRALIEGVAVCARRYGADLVGGDTSCAPGPLALTVTAIGELRARTKPVSRARARPGQAVVASGAFGGSRLGRHLRFEPRFDAGRWLASLGATAMMDVSDGLALDLSRIAALSRVKLEIGHVPVHADARKAARKSGRSALSHALCDGEDHELIATVPMSALLRAAREAPRRCAGFAVLGRVRSGRGLWLPRDELRDEIAPWDGRGGWLHGG